jgi:hypothetical protein
MRDRSNERERERRVKEKERMKKKGGREEERKCVHMCVHVRAWGWKPAAYACEASTLPQNYIPSS